MFVKYHSRLQVRFPRLLSSDLYFLALCASLLLLSCLLTSFICEIVWHVQFDPSLNLALFHQNYRNLTTLIKWLLSISQ